MRCSAANGTINRELATLSKLLRLAYEHRKLQRLPLVKKLREADPRAGFVTRQQFAAVRSHLPEELHVAMTVAYTFGWRKREVLGLKRHQYNAQEATLRLEPGTTKNREGRLVRLTAELHGMLEAQIERVRQMERKDGRVIPWLFPHLDGPQKGEQIVEPRKPWLAACNAAGLPGLLIHDLRRSAVRNMEQAGVARSVAMKLTGHKTEAVYRRYAIVSQADLEEAARKLAAAVTADTTRAAHIALTDTAPAVDDSRRRAEVSAFSPCHPANGPIEQEAISVSSGFSTPSRFRHVLPRIAEIVYLK